eukprot:839088-Pelagomonas_calceolata.AAC.8
MLPFLNEQLSKDCYPQVQNRPEERVKKSHIAVPACRAAQMGRALLVTFGVPASPSVVKYNFRIGKTGLEAIADGDFSVAQAGKAAADLFSMYLNCCPESMGVAGVKREDEVLISMGYLHAALAKYGGA